MAEYLLGGRAVRVDTLAVLFAVEETLLTRTAAAAQCGVSARTLRRFLAGHAVSATTLHKILSGLYLESADVVTYLKPGGR